MLNQKKLNIIHSQTYTLYNHYFPIASYTLSLMDHWDKCN